MKTSNIDDIPTILFTNSTGFRQVRRLIENQITSLVNSIDAGFVKTSTQTHLRFINRSVLLGENHHLKPDMRKEISSAMNTFLSTTLCHDV